MAIIETRYSVGDKVWFAGTVQVAKQHPCPDCGDMKLWQATSPAGNKYSFACPRCAASYSSNSDVSLKYTAHTPTSRLLTIGSVQFNSNHGSYDHGARYMCLESGVGSGAVYDEAKLFETEAEALAAAKDMADKANSTVPHIVEQFNKTLEISDYQLENALLKHAADALRSARQLLRNLNDLFDQIAEADDKDAILEAVDDYRIYNWDRDKIAAGLPVADEALPETENIA